MRKLLVEHKDWLSTGFVIQEISEAKLLTVATLMLYTFVIGKLVKKRVKELKPNKQTSF